MGRPYSKAQGSSAIVVAASDTPGVLKSRADLVCVGTSTTGGDDVYINNALGRADAVVLCPGTFWVSNSISLDTGQSLSGYGPGSIIKVKNGKNANLNMIANSDTTNGNDHIVVKNLKLDGNKANQTASNMNGIQFQNVGYSSVEGIWAESFTRTGIDLVTGCSYNRVLGCTARVNDYDGFREDGTCNTLVQCISRDNGRHGFHHYSGGGNVVGCIAVENRNSGFVTSGGTSGLSFKGNVAIRNDYCGILLDDITSCLVIGNFVIDNSQRGHLGWHQIYLSGVGSGNTITGNLVRAIAVTTTLSGAHSIGATDLTLASSTGFVVGGGITIDADGGSGKQETHRITNISGNVVTIESGLTNAQANGEDVAKPRAGYAIYIIDATVTASVIETNNLYEGGETGVIYCKDPSAIIRNNRGYNPVGISSITVGTSPYTYTARASPETIYVSGGTITSITKGGNNFGLTSGAFNLEPYESIIVTYTVAPTMFKDVH